MSTRNIRISGDEVLRKTSKPVKEITPRLEKLIEDMLETMYESYGVGLAAPQVGVLKRIVVIDCSEEQNDPHIFINPEIIEKQGEQTGYEGCLSLPGKRGIVTRPNYVKVKAMDTAMRPFELEAEGLLARAVCHECDHLDGILYMDLAEGPIEDVPQEEDEEQRE